MYPDSTVYYNSFHPGTVNTPIIDKVLKDLNPPKFIFGIAEWFRKLLWTMEEGALTGLFLAVAEERIRKDNIRGKYFHPMAQEVQNNYANDEQLQDKLWDFSEELIKDFLPVASEPTPVEAEEDEVNAGAETTHDAPVDSEPENAEESDESASTEGSSNEVEENEAKTDVPPSEDRNGHAEDNDAAHEDSTGGGSDPPPDEPVEDAPVEGTE